MSGDTALLEFFTKIKAEGGIVVTDQPKLDLHQYIANYIGRTRFDRLIHIAKCSVPLCVDALKAAISEALAGKDVARYQHAVALLRVAAPLDPLGTPDAAWVTNTDRENKEEAVQLETALKHSKNNLVKDSIRMGNEDLGLHYEKTGDLAKAADYYMSMRQDIGTTEQLVNVTKHAARIAIQMRDWTTAGVHVSKLHGVQLGDKVEDEALARYARIARGLAQLAQGNFEEVARCFLHLEGWPAASETEMVTRSDVAVYGALCALATLERGALQTKVLENQHFRTSLEREPHIRKAISFYVSGRFTAALEILESYRADFLLDIHLQRFVPTLLERIRNKCIVQFVYPYSCVSIDTLQEAFGASGEKPIDEELRELIRSGTLKARINTIEGLLTAVSPDPRVEMQKSAMELANNYERQALERIRRMGIISAGLESRPVKTGNAATQGHQSAEGWFDENAVEQRLS